MPSIFFILLPYVAFVKLAAVATLYLENGLRFIKCPS